jgi:hypothetical protein
VDDIPRPESGARAIAPSLIAEIIEHYDLAMRATASAVTHWVMVGQGLIRLKAQVRETRGPKQWQTFVDRESGLPFRHHQACKYMEVARRHDMLVKKLPPGEVLQIRSLNQLLALTVEKERGPKRPQREFKEGVSGSLKQEAADLASLVIHIHRDWCGRRAEGYQVAIDRREAFEEALPDVIGLLTDLATKMDVPLHRHYQPPIDGVYEKLPLRELLV